MYSWSKNVGYDVRFVYESFILYFIFHFDLHNATKLTCMANSVTCIMTYSVGFVQSLFTYLVCAWKGRRSIDSQSTCCATVRDEKGICCKSGVLDECHVCDGDGTSCATNITVSLVFNSDLQMPHNTSNEWKQFMNTFIQNVSFQNVHLISTLTPTTMM